MIEVIGVNFKENGKVYYFNSNDTNLKENDYVIVETERGLQFAKVINKKYVDKKLVINNLKNVIRKASDSDYKKNRKNEKDANNALINAIKIAEKYKLNMKFIEASFTFDRNQLMFYFLSDNRVDFRDLAKDLASIYKTRIELRQIGVRDEVRRIGGNGVCGRELCCCSFLNNFETVSIKMAKEQNMSLNPSKISGNCGRLMCCLKYEQDVYEEKLKHLPKIGAIVKTEDGEGTVDSIETLKEIVKVKLKDDNDETYFKKYNAADLKIIRNASSEVMDEEEKENMEELQKLEELEKQDKETENNEDIF